MEGRQFGDQGGRRLAELVEFVALDGFEQVDQAAGRGTAAGAAFRIHRQRLDPFPLHRLTQLAF